MSTPCQADIQDSLFTMPKEFSLDFSQPVVAHYTAHHYALAHGVMRALHKRCSKTGFCIQCLDAFQDGNGQWIIVPFSNVPFSIYTYDDDGDVAIIEVRWSSLQLWKTAEDAYQEVMSEKTEHGWLSSKDLEKILGEFREKTKTITYPPPDIMLAVMFTAGPNCHTKITQGERERPIFYEHRV